MISAMVKTASTEPRLDLEQTGGKGITFLQACRKTDVHNVHVQWLPHFSRPWNKLTITPFLQVVEFILCYPDHIEELRQTADCQWSAPSSEALLVDHHGLLPSRSSWPGGTDTSLSVKSALMPCLVPQRYHAIQSCTHCSIRRWCRTGSVCTAIEQVA
jgi:hypothetical protein